VPAQIDNPLEPDRCVYVEWTAGDRGTRTPGGVWWLSPDIQISGPTANQITLGAQPPHPTHTVVCRPHAVANCLGAASAVVVQAFVGTPGVSFTPQTANFVGSTAKEAASVGPNGVDVTITFRPTGTGHQAEGHRCLVVRAFPDHLSPSNESFFLAEGERHAAQRNIAIVRAVDAVGENPAPDELPPGELGTWEVTVGMVNPVDEQVEVGLTIDRDPEPDPVVVETVEPLVQELPFDGFDTTTAIEPAVVLKAELPIRPWRGIKPGTRFPDGIRFRVGDRLSGTTLEAGTELGGLVVRAGDEVDGRPVEPGSALDGYTVPPGLVLRRRQVTVLRPLAAHRRLRWEQLRVRKWQNLDNVAVTLPRGFAGEFGLQLDLRDVPPGKAQLLHLQQTGLDGRPHGGLTLVVLRER
jgi:hypothetical protein